jgi:precorrin-6B methylase 2
MSKFDVDNVARMERMYASGPIAEQRAKTRAALAVTPGEHGLEVGCGIGFLACEMARELARRDVLSELITART